MLNKFLCWAWGHQPEACLVESETKELKDGWIQLYQFYGIRYKHCGAPKHD